MAWVWTKQWSSLDDGSVLYGLNIQNIQTDIVNNAVDLSSPQTVSGDKVFSGNVSFTGSLTNVSKIEDFVFIDGDLVSWEDEAVVYQ